MQIEYDHFSYSSINLFDTCPLRFFVQYVLRIGRDDNKYSLKGNIVHSFNEFLANMHLKGMHLENHWSRILDHILWKYQIRYPKLIKQINIDEIHEICGNVRNSDLFCVDIQGIEKFFVLAIEKDSGKALLVDKRDITQELKKYYYTIVGYMDLIYKDDVSITVRDWKTGKPKTREELRTDTQHKVYTVAASLMFPDYKNFNMEYAYLSTNKFKKISFVDYADDALLYAMDIADKCNKIENCKSFVCKENGLCERFCPFNGICHNIFELLENKTKITKLKLLVNRQLYGDTSGL